MKNARSTAGEHACAINRNRRKAIEIKMMGVESKNEKRKEEQGVFYGSMSGGQREPDKIRVLRGEEGGKLAAGKGQMMRVSRSSEHEDQQHVLGIVTMYRQCRGCLLQENERQRGKICGMNECTWQGRDE